MMVRVMTWLPNARRWMQTMHKAPAEDVLRMAAALLALAVLATLAVIPTPVLARGPVLCTWRILFGVQCPTCGMTRAFSSVLHGQFHAAFQYNKLVTVVFPFTCAVLLRELFRLRRLFAH